MSKEHIQAGTCITQNHRDRMVSQITGWAWWKNYIPDCHYRILSLYTRIEHTSQDSANTVKANSFSVDCNKKKWMQLDWIPTQSTILTSGRSYRNPNIKRRISLKRCMLAGLCRCRDPSTSQLIQHGLSVSAVLSTWREREIQLPYIIVTLHLFLAQRIQQIKLNPLQDGKWFLLQNQAGRERHNLVKMQENISTWRICWFKQDFECGVSFIYLAISARLFASSAIWLSSVKLLRSPNVFLVSGGCSPWRVLCACAHLSFCSSVPKSFFLVKAICKIIGFNHMILE